MFIKTILAAGFALAAAQAHALTLTHAWELNGSTADTLGGPAMSLGDLTGLGAEGYTFDRVEGASVSGVGLGATYSVELKFSFDSINLYERVIDFKDLAFDHGLYTFDNKLRFFFSSGVVEDSAPGAVAAATPVHLVLTRDGTSGEVVLYADGALAFSFVDSGALAVFDGPDGVMHLMQDDNDAGASDENPTGFLDYVRTYSDVATAADALALSNAGVSSVPIPGALPLLAGALGGLAFLRRRKG
jgi:hypothetical protein